MFKSALEAATRDAGSVGSNIFVYGRLSRKLVRQMQGQSAADTGLLFDPTHDIAQRVLHSRRAHAIWKNKLKATLGQHDRALQRKCRAQCSRK